MDVSTDYHDHVHRPVMCTTSANSNHALTAVCSKAVTIIEQSGVEFDAFAFCGISGAYVAPVLAVMMSKGITAVRKEGERCHSGRKVEGAINCRYIIVDDFVSTGATIKHIKDTIMHASPTSQCVGVYQHRDGIFRADY